MNARKKISIAEIHQDEANVNKGTAKGREVLGRSMTRFGAGRSVLLDKNNRIIAGNKTVLAAMKAGIKEVLIVDSDGSHLVAVKRSDIDLDTRQGRELALADNMAQVVGFDIDYSQIDKLEKKYGIHSEIWDIPIDFDGKEGLSTMVGKNDSTITEVIKVGSKRFVISPEELDGLNKSLVDYRDTHGKESGFISFLLNRYYERTGKDS